MKGILGRKVGMTQIYKQDGTVVPVTVVEAGPCFVTQLRVPERDGYRAVQLGFGPAKTKHLTKGQQGHLENAGVPQLRHLREVRTREDETYRLGSRSSWTSSSPANVSIFRANPRVVAFRVVKRHHFAGGPHTHGQSDRERAPGSIGACATPGRVWKGQRMPGQLGNKQTTVQNLEVVLVDPERNLLAVRGSVPGPKGALVLIKGVRKQRVARGG